MSEPIVPEAWIKLPTVEEYEARGRRRGPGRYGDPTMKRMTRLTQAHPRIGPLFAALMREVFVSPDGRLSDSERQMIAAVAAAAQDCTY